MLDLCYYKLIPNLYRDRTLPRDLLVLSQLSILLHDTSPLNQCHFTFGVSSVLDESVTFTVKHCRQTM